MLNQNRHNMRNPQRFHEPIFREQARAILTTDMIQRRERRWPLQQIPTWTKLGSNQTDISSLPFLLDFAALPYLLDKYRGKLTLCGGLPSLWVVAKPNIASSSIDADLFFHNVTTEEANQMLEDCVTYVVLTETKLDHYVRIERRQHITNVVVRFIRNGDPHNGSMLTRVYQFIHRIYPSLDSVLGGFDIPLCMFAYDGISIWGTEIACWSLKYGCIVVDTTRRSTSYEHRLAKYAHRFHADVFFCGIAYGELREPYNPFTIAHTLIELIDDEDLQFVDCDGDEVENKEEWLVGWASNHLKEKQIVHFNDISIDRAGFVKKLYKRLDDPTRKLSNIKKYSDYSSCTIWSEDIPLANATMIRCNNFEGVMVFLEWPHGVQPDEKEVRQAFRDLVVKPEVDVREMYALNIDGYYANHVYSIRWLGIFSDKGNSLINLSSTPGAHTPEYHKALEELKLEINDYVAKEAKRMSQVLIGISWITNNPGRQWTSSCNPIFEDPRKFYGPNYVPFTVGIPMKIETTLRLGRLDKDSILSRLPRDVFNIMLRFVVHQYTSQVIERSPQQAAKETINKIFDLVRARKAAQDQAKE